jgi:hypothetical protein
MIPRLPQPDSLTALALAQLMQGQVLTVHGFMRDTDSHCLPVFIGQLRNVHGWKIDTVKLKVCVDPHDSLMSPTIRCKTAHFTKQSTIWALIPFKTSLMR